jgi:hypothetical protein
MNNHESWLTRDVFMMLQNAECGATLHHGWLLYHSSAQEGNISTYKRKPFTNVDICYCFPLCFIRHLLHFSYDTVIHFLWREASKQLNVNSNGLLCTRKQQNLIFDHINIEHEKNISCRQNYKKVNVFKRIMKYIQKLPVPVAARPKAWVCGRSLAGIAGSNPAGEHGCLSVFSVQVSATGR